MKHDAEMHDLKSIPTVGEQLRGYVYADSRGRFADGDEIVTSTVRAIEGNFIITKNTVYKIVNYEIVNN
jgi:hypothetical protein